jgi:transposase InsO family protein
MPFKPISVMEEKLEFVRLASSRTVKFSTLCKRYGISRPTGYKWLKRYNMKGRSGLIEFSRRPENIPRFTSEKTVKTIATLRESEPSWGAKKLRVLMLRDGKTTVPSVRTINRILKRQGLSSIGADRPKKVERFEYTHSNELWQMDFKGHFALMDKTRCFPLTITDDHSRFNIVLTACVNQRLDTVRKELIKAFKKYGLPDTILCDNSPPWGSTHTKYKAHRRTITQMEAWLIRLGVRMIHGRPYHPQTQGKCERFHQTLKKELLQYNQFRNQKNIQNEFNRWRKKYNNYRPHEGINMLVPADKYAASERNYPLQLPEIIYGSNDILLKVSQKGFIRFQGKDIYLGEGLQKQTIALRHNEDPKLIEAYYCNQMISKLNLKV